MLNAYRFLIPGAIFCLFAAPLGASTIVSTDLGSAGYLELFGNFADEVAWTQTSTFTGVTVSAEIDPGGNGETPARQTGVAYLTTSIGPGTTIADQIATTTFSVTGLQFHPTDVSLFSGLTLGPGTYYLILTSSGDQPGGWEITSTAITPVTAPGVTDIDRGHENSNLAAYLPASNFNLANGNPTEFSVTGTATAPEPSTLPIVAAVLALLAIRSLHLSSRKRKHS